MKILTIIFNVLILIYLVCLVIINRQKEILLTNESLSESKKGFYFLDTNYINSFSLSVTDFIIVGITLLTLIIARFAYPLLNMSEK